MKFHSFIKYIKFLWTAICSLFIAVIVLLYVKCSHETNNIDFDIEKQSFSTSSKGFMIIGISEPESSMIVFFEKKRDVSLQKNVKLEDFHVYFDKADSDEDNTYESPNSILPLKPLSQYEILNTSWPDATALSIIILTDEKGRVYKVKKEGKMKL